MIQDISSYFNGCVDC